MFTKFWSENVKGRNHLGDLDGIGGKILKGYVKCRRDSTGPREESMAGLCEYVMNL
jgi:hypothetical protein